MRRVSEISVQVDEGWTAAGERPQRPKRHAKPIVRRLRWRWPNALRSKAVRVAIVASLSVLIVAIGIALFPTQRVIGQMLAWSGRAGFRVDDIYVEGRARTPRDQLLTALAVKRGDAIFAVDLAATRHRLEMIPWVRTVAVERRLPNQIHLLITERLPVALWQNKGRYFLVDRDGQVVGDQIGDYTDLPLTVGEGAPDHVSALIALLQSEETLKSRVKAAAWVGERRWNITLGDIEVRLPEDTALEAWHDLAQLEKDQKLLERQISVVDMRLPDRLVLRAANAPQGPSAKPKPLSGKDA